MVEFRFGYFDVLRGWAWFAVATFGVCCNGGCVTKPAYACILLLEVGMIVAVPCPKEDKSCFVIVFIFE